MQQTFIVKMTGKNGGSSVACNATTIIINEAQFLFDVLRTSYIDWFFSPPLALSHSRTPHVHFITCNKHVSLIDVFYAFVLLFPSPFVI